MVAQVNLKVYHNQYKLYNILYFVELWDNTASATRFDSDFMWTRDVNTLSYTDGNFEADIDLGSGAIQLKRLYK